MNYENHISSVGGGWGGLGFGGGNAAIWVLAIIAFFFLFDRRGRGFGGEGGEGGGGLLNWFRFGEQAGAAKAELNGVVAGVARANSTLDAVQDQVSNLKIEIKETALEQENARLRQELAKCSQDENDHKIAKLVVEKLECQPKCEDTRKGNRIAGKDAKGNIFIIDTGTGDVINTALTQTV